MRGNHFCPLAFEPATTPAVAGDLISILKALLDCRMLRDIRLPQCWMLLAEIQAILIVQGSLVGMERLAKRKRHRQMLNELLATCCWALISASPRKFDLPAAAGPAGCRAL